MTADNDSARPLAAREALSSNMQPVGRPADAARLPVLIVLHQPQSTPGHVGRILREKGHPLDIRRPRYGDPLPTTLQEHAGAVIFGGPMSANDPDDYIRLETEWLAVPLAEQKPFLGICLGAQMLARFLGGTVAEDTASRVEIGYHDIVPCAVNDDVFGDCPERVYQWHREGFTAPAGSVKLAVGREPFADQAFRYGPTAYGVQFHPEITHALISRWTTMAAHRLVHQGAQPREHQLNDHILHGVRVRAWLDQMLERWLAAGQRQM